MVNDRGNIKWTAMMMPDHINMLNQMWRQEEFKKKPIIDEQQMLEIDMKLQLAIHNDLSVIVEYYKDHDYYKARGKLKKVDIAEMYLQIYDENSTKVLLKNILDIQID